MIDAKEKSSLACSNWVNDVLDKATRIVAAWPAWMRRPEFSYNMLHDSKTSNTKPLIK